MVLVATLPGTRHNHHQENPMRRNAQGWLGLGVATVAMLAALVAAQGTRPSERTESTELAVTATTAPVVAAVPEATSLRDLDTQVYLHAVHAERVAAAAERAAERAADDARRAAAAKEAQKASRGAPRSPGGSLGGGWAALRQCENGGSYTSRPGDRYRGAYQFDYSTWRSVGGSGDPAAAPPAEQDMRARMLYEQRGASPWPRCGRYL